MTFPDACPNCGAITHADPFQYRRIYACRSWINAGRESLAHKTDTCCDWRKIKDAAAVICAFLDADPEARQKGQDWLAGNMP